jgi:hypothetical protein
MKWLSGIVYFVQIVVGLGLLILGWYLWYRIQDCSAFPLFWSLPWLIGMMVVMGILAFGQGLVATITLVRRGRNVPPTETSAPPRMPEPPARPVAKKPPAAKPPARSDAITLLAALQREARFVDFIQEPLTGYTDAQIGAAARDVHRDCGAVLARMFALRPAVSDEEGKEVEVPAGFDSGRWRLTGNVTGEPPFRGRLVHPGWEATTCELPTWSGTAAAQRIVAPAEVELR